MKKTVLFLAVNLICFSCVTGYSQKRIDQVEDQQRYEKIELAEMFAPIVSMATSCIPMHVKSRNHVERVVMMGHALFDIYAKDSSLHGNNVRMIDYYQYAVKFIMGDTLELSATDFDQFKNGWDYHPVRYKDGISDFPEDQKQEFLKRYCDDSGELLLDEDFTAIIAKLFDWGIFVIHNDGKGFWLFYPSDYIEREPVNMIWKSLINVLGRMNPGEKIFVIDDGYPPTFYPDDYILEEYRAVFMKYEEVVSEYKGKILQDSLRMVLFDSMIFDEDKVMLSFSENKLFQTKGEKFRRRQTIISAYYIYKYDPKTRRWKMMDAIVNDE